MTMSAPATKADLRARMRTMYDALDAAIAPIPPFAMLIPGVNGAWSVKDTLAHLAYWDWSVVAYLDYARAGGAPNPAGTGGDDDIWNARCFTAQRARTLEDVFADCYRARHAIFRAVDALPDDALFDADRFAWRKGSPLWESLDETEDGHYPEHIAQINQWRSDHLAAPTTRAGVLWWMEDWHTALHTLVDAVPPGWLPVPGVNGEWSIKDAVAHLSYWLDALLERLNGAREGTAPAITNVTDAEIDRRNADCLAQSQQRRTNDVLMEYDAAYARVVEAVHALPEDALFDAHRFPWTNGRPLVGYIGGNTWEHYPEHVTQIRRWLATR
jgi:hypothetical protein